MKILAIVITGLFVTIMIVAANHAEDPAPKPELKKGYVLIHKTGSETGTVTFFHRRHKKYAMDDKKCKTCHHVGKWGQSCGEAGCHNDPEKDKEGIRIHVSCIERCHRANEDKAPTDCLECHQETTEGK